MTVATVPLAFTDTETTSLRPDREVWEVGIFHRPAGGGPGTETEHHVFLPVTLCEADPFALKIGGFYDRHPYGRFLSGQAQSCPEYLLPWTGDGTYPWRLIGRILHGAHVVGAVPNFDTEAMATPLRDADVLPAHHYHLVDVENLTVGYLAGQGIVLPPPWKSDDLAERLGLDPVPESERHTAIGDARFVTRIWDRIMGAGTAERAA